MNGMKRSADEADLGSHGDMGQRHDDPFQHPAWQPHHAQYQFRDEDVMGQGDDVTSTGGDTASGAGRSGDGEGGGRAPTAAAAAGSGGGGRSDNVKGNGRRKINIAYIQDKARRQITFSKRKAGLMKKAFELSTLTGTQVLLLVASETGHVYTFATPKLQPLITQATGKDLIQACLNTDGPAQPFQGGASTTHSNVSSPVACVYNNTGTSNADTAPASYRTAQLPALSAVADAIPVGAPGHTGSVNEIGGRSAPGNVYSHDSATAPHGTQHGHYGAYGSPECAAYSAKYWGDARAHQQYQAYPSLYHAAPGHYYIRGPMMTPHAQSAGVVTAYAKTESAESASAGTASQVKGGISESE
ncbi:hypothetical protein SeMB42_g02952 [Synchytrium endobioticum]|uniref:MADS-box domain-containing protein n=1 Tax=Synchytrium endobioticum TaxID=286115 RepID=A0A507DA59_9FUNG|nr:hypothetical protein SeLEV6574_g06788 [Synchytrium endobioticum]TPX48522.1 hypothetical protein SeMB42_g02952 [Synchytrium endobioticum]